MGTYHFAAVLKVTHFVHVSAKGRQARALGQLPAVLL